MQIKTQFRSGFVPRLRVVPLKQRLSRFSFQINRKIVAQNSKEKDEEGLIVPLKVLPEILKNPQGIGIIAVTATSKLAEVSINSVQSAVEKDLKPALENSDENLENWKESINSAIKHADESRREAFNQLGANLREAWTEIVVSTDAANQKLAKEAEIGAENWEKTKAALLNGSTDQQSSRKDRNVVAVLTDVEDKGTKLITDLGKSIVDLGNRKDSLQTGWLSSALSTTEQQEIAEKVGEQPQLSQPAVIEPDPSARSASNPFFQAVARFAKGYGNDENKGNMSASSAINDNTKTNANEVSTREQQQEEQSDSANTTKSILSPTLDAVTKGGKHVSMLSAPFGTNNKVDGQIKNNNNVAGGGASVTNNMMGEVRGRKSELNALRAAAGAGASVSGTSGGNGGDNTGGNGGGGNNNDNEGPSSSGDDNGNNQTMYLLLLALVLASVGYYFNRKERDSKKK